MVRTKMAPTKWHEQNGTDKAVRTKWYGYVNGLNRYWVETVRLLRRTSEENVHELNHMHLIGLFENCRHTRN